MQQAVRAFVAEQVQFFGRECGEEYRARHGEENYLAAELSARAPLVLFRFLKDALRGVARGAAAAVVVPVRVMMVAAAFASVALLVPVRMIVATAACFALFMLVEMPVIPAAGAAFFVFVFMLVFVFVAHG